MTAEMKKTLAFVVVALVLTGAAFVKIPDRIAGQGAFDDQRQKFFPEFTDPFACTDLEVAEFDETAAKPRLFKVMFVDGRWTIPSHNSYPADAKDRLAKTAGGVMDLNKDTIRSDRVDDHEALGVLDPLDPKAGLKGQGKRVTLRDKSKNVLADFIIGKEVRERPGMKYVRIPGQKRTYGVNVTAEVRDRALAIIRTDSEARRQLISDRQAHLPEQSTMIARRDAAIRAILPESAHSQFDANAARLTESRKV